VSDGEKRRQESTQGNCTRQGHLFVPRRHAREGEERHDSAGDGNSCPGLEGIARDEGVPPRVEQRDVIGRVSRRGKYLQGTDAVTGSDEAIWPGGARLPRAAKFSGLAHSPAAVALKELSRAPAHQHLSVRKCSVEGVE